ncbi:MAG: polyprenyl synthetase family protein [Candidatus Nanopelagicales bacterium]
MTSPPRLTTEQLRSSVQGTLDEFVAEQAEILAGVSTDLVPFTDTLRVLLAGGKRLRPAFCMWGYLGAGGSEVSNALRAATSLEMLQACALVHDDVMDDSDMRRGQPAAHRQYATRHRGEGWLGDAGRFGDGAAILLGDLCLSWSDELLYRSGFDAQALARAKVVYDRMRTELMAGQYLDLLEQARSDGSAQRALLVVRYKSAKYTIERPLHLGAALAGAQDDLLAALSAYGLPLGEAFQLRDDVLGVFGDPAETGKPAGDDLREGKRTLLVATAMQHADATQAAQLRAGLGDPHLGAAAIESLRSVIVATGALDEVESVIARRTDEAMSALDAAGLAADVHAALTDLAIAATARRV